MRVLILMAILLAACAPVRGPVDQVGTGVTVTEPAAAGAAGAPPVGGSNGMPFSLRLF